jgi:hypothetical protein
MALLYNSKGEILLELPTSPRSRKRARFRLALALVVASSTESPPAATALPPSLSVVTTPSALPTAIAERSAKVGASLALYRGRALSNTRGGAVDTAPLERELERVFGSTLGVVGIEIDSSVADVEAVCNAVARCGANEDDGAAPLLDAFAARLVTLASRGRSFEPQSTAAAQRAAAMLCRLAPHSPTYELHVLHLLGRAVHDTAQAIATAEARTHARLVAACSAASSPPKPRLVETLLRGGTSAQHPLGQLSISMLLDNSYLLLETFERIACAPSSPRPAEQQAPLSTPSSSPQPPPPPPQPPKRRRLGHVHGKRAGTTIATLVQLERVRIAASIALGFAGAFDSEMVCRFSSQIYRRLIAILERAEMSAAAGSGSAALSRVMVASAELGVGASM